MSTKLKRANERRPALGKAILSSTKDVAVIDIASGAEHDVVEVPLDGCRLHRVLGLIGLGLYRYHFGKRWVGGFRVHPDFIGSADSMQMFNIDTDRCFLFHAVEKLFVSEMKYGENPDVFYHQVYEPEGKNICLMRLVFYGGCTVTAFFSDGPI